MNWKTEQEKLANLKIREKIDLEKNERRLRDPWEYNKIFNICVVEVLEGQEKEDGDEKYLNK